MKFCINILFSKQIINIINTYHTIYLYSILCLKCQKYAYALFAWSQWLGNTVYMLCNIFKTCIKLGYYQCCNADVIRVRVKLNFVHMVNSKIDCLYNAWWDFWKAQYIFPGKSFGNNGKNDQYFDNPNFRPNSAWIV